MEEIKGLLEALPYIRKFQDAFFVIKCGGKVMEDKKAKQFLAEDLALLRFVGFNPVVVHGGGPIISKEMKKVGKKPKFIEGLRITDTETLEIVRKVFSKLNDELVSRIEENGSKAIGISGEKVIRAAQKSSKKLGYVGEVKQIATHQIRKAAQEAIPIISTLGTDTKGTLLNINSDTAAGETAAALKATKLIILTDVPGILKDPNDLTSLISVLKLGEAEKLLARHKLEGGMIPKVEACINALRKGVKQAHIISGLKPHSLLLEIFTDTGIGTMIMGG